MQRTPDALAMVQALIAQPSISSPLPELDQSNLGVLDALSNWLEPLGFAIERVPLPGQPHKANLIATLGHGDGGLVLAGHTDTVPFDANAWRFDPFKGHHDDAHIYGLGACDMKGFIALAVAAASRIDPAKLTAPLIILATADEETTMAGARELVRLGRPKARYAVVGEPTGLKPIRLHKGIFSEAAHLWGKSGHSSDPSLGINAIDGMAHVLNALVAWRDAQKAAHANPHFHVPHPTLNFGYVHGGDNPNRICAHCEVHFDVRPLPGQRCADLRADLRAHLRDALAKHGPDGLRLEMKALFEGLEAFETPDTSALVQAATAMTGHAAGAVGFGTEGPLFNQLGMETIILGPGDIAQAHQPDESLALSSIPTTIDLLERLIHRFCCA